jgi:hypothetical protein
MESMPVKDDLREFLRERVAKSGAPSRVDWEARKRDWIGAVERLYDTIESDFFKDARREKLVKVQRREVQVAEQYIGRYKIPELVVRIGNEEVVFSPKAVNVIGAAGRIDLIGERGQATIIRERDSKTRNESWSVVETRIPSRRVVPLTQQSLLAALRQVMTP